MATVCPRSRTRARAAAIVAALALALASSACGTPVPAAVTTSPGATAVTTAAPSTINKPWYTTTTRHEPHPVRPATLAFLGDSMIAIGQVDYVAAVERAGYSVTAFAAHSGSTLGDAYAGYDWPTLSPHEVLDTRPAVLYVSFGINESVGSVDEALTNFDRLLHEARVHGVQCVVWQTWLGDADPQAPAQMQHLHATWTWLRGQAASRPDLELNDLQPVLEQYGQGWSRPDDIHFSEVGVANNAVAMVEAIQRCPELTPT